MINYTLPDFTVGLKRNLFFAELFERSPEIFQDHVRLTSVYGCFPNCIANGGRAFVREPYTETQVRQTFELLAAHKLTARLTLTNMLLEPQHLKDPYLQMILRVASDYDTDIILYSDVMDKYIRSDFNFKRILSTTKEILDIDALNAATEQFDYVVLNYNLNKDAEFIARIGDKRKIEVMVNEFCSYRCPNRQDHYLHNSQDQLAQSIRPYRNCGVNDKAFFRHESGHPVLFTSSEVQQCHSKYDIENFKIVGRGVPATTVLEAYIYYLIKPEYSQPVRNVALRA